MHKSPRNVASFWLLVAGLCVPLSAWGPSLCAQTGQSLVRRVKVMGSKDSVEIEIEASGQITPQTQVLTGPDRLVVDFPNAVPGNELRSQSVNRGGVKDLRVGLFQSRPPVTRVVLDLRIAQSYQVFPEGRTVIIKVLGTPAPAMDASSDLSDFLAKPATRPGLVNANFTTGGERIHGNIAAKLPVEVSFRDGLLAIKSNKATLSEVLFAVQQRTGADIAIPAGAEQERVMADLGPAPAQEVLAHLLNGSRFNFLILNSASNPRQLDRVILTPRVEGAVMPQPAVQSTDDTEDEAQAPPPQAQPNPVPPPPVVMSPPGPEIPPPIPEDSPEQ
jgi:hypothetical protein